MTGKFPGFLSTKLFSQPKILWGVIPHDGEALQQETSRLHLPLLDLKGNIRIPGSGKTGFVRVSRDYIRWRNSNHRCLIPKITGFTERSSSPVLCRYPLVVDTDCPEKIDLTEQRPVRCAEIDCRFVTTCKPRQEV